MFLNKDPRKEKWFAYTVASCSAVLLYVLLTNLGVFLDGFFGIIDVISPIIVGIVFAYILSPICELLEVSYFSRIHSKRVARLASVAAAVVLVLIVFVVLLGALLPQLAASIMLFVGNIGTYMGQSRELLDRASEWANTVSLDISPHIQSLKEAGYKWLNEMPDKLNALLAVSYGFSVSVANVVLSFILAIYFLIDSENLKAGARKFLSAIFSPKSYHAVAGFWGRCNKILIKYITFDIIDGFIVGIINFVFMLVFRVPYSVLISVIVGVTNLAPTFGPIAGAILGGFILLLAEPIKALIFLLFVLILQTIDGYLIKPRLFGSSLGVPPVWILITIIIGGNLFGVIGILLAIPFAAIMTFVYYDFIEKSLDERRQKNEEKEKRKE